jgi:glucose/mannose-6-phosphate isomerase
MSQSVIAQRDPQDALGFAAGQPEQLKHDFGIAAGASFERPIQNVVFAGMGGSALVAEFVHTWPRLKVPFVVCKEYNLPEFVSQDTLVICGSYSGNTEETLEALGQAKQRGAQIAIVTHGGKLAERARQDGYVFAELPECPQPRTGVFYAYRAVVEILVAAQACGPQSAFAEQAASYRPPRVCRQKLAAQRADHAKPRQATGPSKCWVKRPSSTPGQKCTQQPTNGRSAPTKTPRTPPRCNIIPEFNHNEFIGWSSHPVEKPFAVIDLLSIFEHPRVQKRFEVTDRLLSGMRPKSN